MVSAEADFGFPTCLPSDFKPRLNRGHKFILEKKPLTKFIS
jgi:hypothetical protein